MTHFLVSRNQEVSRDAGQSQEVLRDIHLGYEQIGSAKFRKAKEQPPLKTAFFELQE